LKKLKKHYLVLQTPYFYFKYFKSVVTAKFLTFAGIKISSIFISESRIKILQSYSHIKKLVMKSKVHKSLKQPVLFWGYGGFPIIMQKDLVVAHELIQRDEIVHVVVCDGTTPICMQYEENKAKPDCVKCCNEMRLILKMSGIKHTLSKEHIELDDLRKIETFSQTISLPEIKDFQYLGVPVGKISFASFLRYRCGKTINENTLNESDIRIYQKYFLASLINTHIAKNALRQILPKSFFSSHGCYSDFGTAMYSAHLHKIPAITWTSGYNDFHHYYSTFCDNKFVFRGIPNHTWRSIKVNKLNQFKIDRLYKFLESRYCNQESMDIRYANKPVGTDTIRETLGLDINKPTACLFTHLNWDAADLASSFFTDSDEWLFESLKVMMKNKNINWIIKIHPAELRYKNLTSTTTKITEKFPILPPHVKIINPSQEINTLDIYHLIDVGITIFGTVGVELPLYGKPIISAGHAHFTEKGFSFDTRSRLDYLSLLSRLNAPLSLNNEQISLAQIYAYSFFFERHLPLDVIDISVNSDVVLDIEKINCNINYKTNSMDEICRCILTGEPAILSES
jgi:hypothetical protein